MNLIGEHFMLLNVDVALYKIVTNTFVCYKFANNSTLRTAGEGNVNQHLIVAT